MANEALPILDCHQHFIDARRLTYPVFAQRSAGFEALVGDYAALPRVYLPQNYARDVAGLNVVATVGAEFIADHAQAELRWLSGLGAAGGHPDALIAPVDFQSPDLAGRLDLWASLGRVRAVRQHLAWHPTNPLLRYASRPDLLAHPDWRRGLARLRGRGLVCELELFSTQPPQLAAVAAAFPEIDFVLPVMGWPVDVSDAGRAAWRRRSPPSPPAPMSGSSSSGSNASSASTGPWTRPARGSSMRSTCSARPAACSRATCRSAGWPAACSGSTPPTST